MSNVGGVVVFTGPSAGGKSTYANEALGMMRPANGGGKPAVFLNDYFVRVVSWAKDPQNKHLVDWRSESDFLFRPEAYGELSPFVARDLGGQTATLLLGGETDLVLLEVARGIVAEGQIRDDYIEGFFVPFVQAMREGGVAVFNMAHVEVETSYAVARDRGAVRKAMDDGAPPLEVIDRYFGSDGKPNLSAYDSVAQMRGELESQGIRVVNARFQNNEGGGECRRLQLEGFLSTVVDQFGLEGRVVVERALGDGKERKR